MKNTTSCPEQLLGAILLLASDEALNIKNLGPALAELLVKSKVVKNIADVYHLDDISHEAFVQPGHEAFKGLTKHIVDQLKESIRASKNTSLERFIYALGIKCVGSIKAKKLAASFCKLDFIMKANLHSLSKVIGKASANNVYAYFQSPSNVKLVESFLKAGVTWPEFSMGDLSGRFFSGKKFVVTGTMKSPRRDISKLITSKGGTVQDKVSKNVSYLVYGHNPGTKLNKAQSLGIKTLDETQFLAIANSVPS